MQSAYAYHSYINTAPFFPHLFLFLFTFCITGGYINSARLFPVFPFIRFHAASIYSADDRILRSNVA